jgi:hypothetical protein
MINISLRPVAIPWLSSYGWRQLIGTAVVFVLIFLAGQSARANPLAEALGQPGLTVTSSGDANWVVDEAISFDGIDSVRSGAVGDSEISILEATVAGPGEVAFRWRVSSQAGADMLSFAINGEANGPQLSGESGWQTHTATLGAGDHTLRWTYAKDASTSTGSDRAWVDELSVPPQSQPAIAVQPVPASHRERASVTHLAAFRSPDWTRSIARAPVHGLTPRLRAGAAVRPLHPPEQ